MADLERRLRNFSSHYSPDLAEALVAGPHDATFLPAFDLRYDVVGHEPLIVLMPSDHRLANCDSSARIHRREFHRRLEQIRSATR